MVVGSCPCRTSLANARNFLSLGVGLVLGGWGLEWRGQALEEIMEVLDGVVNKVSTCECVNRVGEVFGLLLEPLEEHMYLLFQVHRGRPCQQKSPGARGVQERVVEQGMYHIEGGGGGLGGSDPVGSCCLFRDPW